MNSMGEKNNVVFTTRSVLEEKKTVTLVFHDSDGIWSFFSDNDTNESKNAKIISIRDILVLDPSISALKHLPKGFKASRKNKNDKWKIEKN